MTDDEALRLLYNTQQKFQEIHAKKYKKFIIDRNDVTKYPWMIYWTFGWHNMQYLTDEEAEKLIKEYHLTKITQEGKEMYVRYGREPITIMKR